MAPICFVTRTFRACGARQFFWFPLLFPFCGAAHLQTIWGQGAKALLQMTWGQEAMNQGGTSIPDQICGRAGEQEDVSKPPRNIQFVSKFAFSPSLCIQVQNPTSSFIQNPTNSFVQKSISSFVQHPEIFQRGLRCWRWN